MKIQINISDVSNNNNIFDLLTITNEQFSYLGNGILDITKFQIRLLELNHVKFKVVVK